MSLPMTDLLSNSANASLHELAAEDARQALSPLKQRREQVLASMQAFTIQDDEDVRRAADKVALAQALIDASDEALKPIGGPFQEASHAVRTAALNFTDDLKAAKVRANQAINAFRDRQREAAAKAANEQREREAELRRKAGMEATPAAPVRAGDVKLAPTRSDYRANVHDRRVTKVSIEDARALPDTILKSPGVVKALETAVRQMAKLTTDIPGATVEFDQSSSVKVN